MSNSQHFDAEAHGSPTAPGRFVTVSDITPVDFAPGLQFQPVVGEKTLTNFVRFAEHSLAPVHVHEEEQIVMVLEGALEFSLDGEVRTLRPGDMAVVPSWVPHGAWTLDEPCYEVDVFAPPRQSLLEIAEAANGSAGPSDGS